jgi:hypothetical protein
LKTKHLTIIGMLFCLLPSSGLAQSAGNGTWTPERGDSIVVDTDNSTVYLVHADGEYLAIDGLTGQRRVVSYDGITYNATTPERTWEMRDLELKGRSVTFGEGRFLRLSWPGHRDVRRGDESTAYGFHSHLSFERMIADKQEKNSWDRTGTGWRSMGCILVSEADLTLITQTWERNEGVLAVTTKRGVDVAEFAPITTIAEVKPSWLGWLIP